MAQFKFFSAIALVMSLFLAGCSSTQTDDTAGSETDVTTSSTGDAGAGTDTGAVDVVEPEITGETVFADGTITVYFDFDSSEIRADSKAALDTIAEGMNNDASSIVVEGHADERGTREYNQALGERRSLAVREYLQTKGVASDRVRVKSYGEERPAAEGHDESAWSQNRRAEIKPQ